MKNTRNKSVEYPAKLLVVRPLRRQSLVVFWLLVSKRRVMSAAQIAECLGMHPRNVNRAVKPLIERRMVRVGKLRVTQGKPRYWALPMHYAEQMYMSHVRQEFRSIFGEAYSEKWGPETHF